MEQPSSSTKFSADIAQLVEHHLAMVRVAGSNPVVRSIGETFRWRKVSNQKRRVLGCSGTNK